MPVGRKLFQRESVQEHHQASLLIFFPDVLLLRFQQGDGAEGNFGLQQKSQLKSWLNGVWCTSSPAILGIRITVFAWVFRHRLNRIQNWL